MKRKLLVTGSTFPRWENDTEPRFVLDLSEALTKYFDVTVLVPASQGAKDEEDINDVKVIRYHYFPIYKFETLCYPGAIVPRIREKKIRILLVPFLLAALYFQLRKRVKAFDIIHAHWLIPQGIMQSFFKKPYIVTGHGGDITSLNSGIIKKLKRRTLEKASHITVVSKHLKNEVTKISSLRNIDIISMGCKTDNFDKHLRVENMFNQGSKKVILFVGRLAEKKGVKYLIDAMKDIDALLVIVGGGPLEQQLKERANIYSDKILFLGSKTHEELKVIYASADVFVAPSVTASDGDQEGFGLVILEAMASSLPIVANNSGGITDLIKDGQNGLLAEEKNVSSLSEKINKLLSNDSYSKELGDKARKTAEEYDYKIIAAKYAEILNKL